MKKPKRGRPATERGAYNPNPARQLGRVGDEDWELLKAAAAKRGEKFTPWALRILLAAAKRELSRHNACNHPHGAVDCPLKLNVPAVSACIALFTCF